MTLRRALGSVLLSAALGSALSGCSATVDSLGSKPSASADDGSAGAPDDLLSFSGPQTYPNLFKDLLNASDSDISTKLNLAFRQLFVKSDSTTADQLIYYPYQASSDKSVILDILHNYDIRTEGMGLAMVIMVEFNQQMVDFNQQTEFDKLWTYAKTEMKQTSGPGSGYFASHCDEDTVTPCLDTYGMQQFALALILASRYWSDKPGAAGYATDALALLAQLKDGEGGAFDHTTYLVREQPTLAPANLTRSALEMPAAYELWYQATGDPFWESAAKAGRQFLMKSADKRTGLWPMRSNFDGSAVASNAPGYTAQAYRTQLNLALDAAWNATASDQKTYADKLLTFFDDALNNQTYGANFAVDGTLTLDDGVTPDSDATPSQALISVNGALVVATSDAYPQARSALVSAVWQQAIPSGNNRYYEGLLYMTSLLILSGQLQVH